MLVVPVIIFLFFPLYVSPGIPVKTGKGEHWTELVKREFPTSQKFRAYSEEAELCCLLKQF